MSRFSKKIMVVIAITVVAAVPGVLVYHMEKDMENVKLMYGMYFVMVGCGALYLGAVSLLRKALIFLGMKPETADRQYGWPWRY